MKTITTWEELSEFINWCIANGYLEEDEDGKTALPTPKWANTNPMELMDDFITEKELNEVENTKSTPNDGERGLIVP